MANEAEVFSRPNTDAKIHDLEQFTLWTNTPDRPGFRARMTFGERNGAPRITVFPNFEEGPKVLYVGMHPMIFMEFLERFNKIASGPAGKKDRIENMDISPIADRKEGDNAPKVVRNTLWFGKDEEGICWIGIEQPNVKNVVFKILSSSWHNFFNEDGTRVSAEQASSAQTRMLVQCLRVALAPYIARIRPAWEKPTAGTTSVAKAPVKTTTFDEDINY